MDQLEGLPEVSDWKFEPSDPECGLKTFVGEAVGAASMCWENPEGAGVFDSTRASVIVDAILERATTAKVEDVKRVFQSHRSSIAYAAPELQAFHLDNLESSVVSIVGDGS